MKHIALKTTKVQLKKNIILGKAKVLNFYFFIFLLLLFNSKSYANDVNFIDVKILDKVNSKTSQLSLKINQESKFENLIIKVLKCKNSEFDDNPEVTAYMQVKDITIKNNDKVFIFNGWTFSSSPSISLFDHPIYDIWLIKCY